MPLHDFAEHYNGQTDAPELPHNIDAEQSVLGGILLDNQLLFSVSDILDQTSFYDPMHGSLYALIARLIDGNQLANPVSLKPHVASWPPITADLLVWQYLVRLVVAAAHRSDIRSHARQVADLAARRRVVGVAQDLMHMAMTAPADTAASAIVEDAERGLFEIVANRIEGREVAIADAVVQAVESVAKAYERGGGMCGVPTGLIDLDSKLGGFQASDLIILAGRPAMGKAQPIYAPIKMHDGTWREIGTLRMGDRVASIDGAPSVVAGVYPQGMREIFRVTFSDGRSTECCAEHLWRVHHRKWAVPRVMQLQDVVALLCGPSMRKRLWIDTVSGDFGSSPELPIEPWLLGALVGNGNFHGGTPKFSTSSTHTAFTLKQAVGFEFKVEQKSPYDFSIVQSAGASRSGVCGTVANPITSALKMLGLHGLRSEDKFIPDVYKFADRATRTAVLRGLLDTDGWVEKHGTVRYGTSSARLRDDVRDLVWSLGGICSVATKIPTYTYRGEKKTGLPTYTLNIMMSDYSGCLSEPRKVARLLPTPKGNRLSFESIESVGHREAVCISVTHPSRLYVTTDYIVTHNTALATTIAFNVARERVGEDGVIGAGPHVHFFSQEMSAQQLAMRLIADRAELPSDRMRRGDINEAQFRHMLERAKGVSVSAITVDETGGITLAALAAKARRTKRKRDTRLIIIDYLQLMSGAARSGDNRVQEITKITMGLKALAKELDVPILALSQLSRKVEERSDKRPQLADLRESGSIEQDADVVMFVYRDEYYVEREKPDEFDSVRYADWQSRMERTIGKAEVIIGKQRHGSTGTVPLSFQAQFTRFGNLGSETRHG